MERKIFRGIGAVITSVETDRKFTVVARMRDEDDNDFSAARRIPIDLDRTPIRSASWNDIEIDDRGIRPDGAFLGCARSAAALTGYHITSLGGYQAPNLPDDLALGPFVGAVYLEQAMFDRHRSKIDRGVVAWPTPQLRSYQLTTIAYSRAPENGEARLRRYVGLHARLKRRVGSAVVVELYDFTGKVFRTWDGDLRDAADCDPNPPVAAGERALAASSEVGDEGAIYLELGHAARFDGPKIPIGLDGLA